MRTAYETNPCALRATTTNSTTRAGRGVVLAVGFGFPTTYVLTRLLSVFKAFIPARSAFLKLSSRAPWIFTDIHMRIFPPLYVPAHTIITHTRPAQVSPQSLPCSCEHKEELEVLDEANAKSGNKAWLSRRLHAAIVREQQWRRQVILSESSELSCSPCTPHCHSRAHSASQSPQPITASHGHASTSR